MKKNYTNLFIMINKKRWVVALLTIFALMAVASTSQTVVSEPMAHAIDACSIENTTFKGGEELVYKLYYNWNFIWISAGEVTFKVDDYGDNFHISANGRTYRSYDWAFKVRDYYECDINKSTMLPEHSIRNVKEGGFRLYDEISFDQANKKVVSRRGKTPTDAQKQSFVLDNCTHDILSILYYVRSTNLNDFRKGDVLPVEIFMDKKVWPLEVKYAGKESGKKVKGLGRFNTHKFNPELISGDVFKEGDEMTVWVSDDGNKIPVLVESPISVGSVKVVLKSYKGLKYPLSSKTK